MFVNDTGSLPESGRVCVMGFAGGASAPREFFSININAARAEVEPMAEPRNPAHVLGVGAEIPASAGKVFAAYFARSRERFDPQPDYRGGLFVLVDGAVFGVRLEGIATRITRGLSTREFTLLRGDRPMRKVRYPWPWYREPFLRPVPGQVRSKDFLSELAAMVGAYG